MINRIYYATIREIRKWIWGLEGRNCRALQYTKALKLIRHNNWRSKQ